MHPSSHRVHGILQFLSNSVVFWSFSAPFFKNFGIMMALADVLGLATSVESVDSTLAAFSFLRRLATNF